MFCSSSDGETFRISSVERGSFDDVAAVLISPCRYFQCICACAVGFSPPLALRVRSPTLSLGNSTVWILLIWVIINARGNSNSNNNKVVRLIDRTFLYPHECTLAHLHRRKHTHTHVGTLTHNLRCYFWPKISGRRKRKRVQKNPQHTAHFFPRLTILNVQYRLTKVDVL